MRLRILGCSGGIGEGRRSSCYMLDDDILLDCGTGVGHLTRAEMCRIKHVFLTHSHLDHVCGLPLFVDTIFDKLEEPLIVHAQPETIQAMKDHLLNWTIWPDFAELPHPDEPVLVYEPMEPGMRVEVEGKVFEMLPGDHVVSSMAYVISESERSFCLSGDTTTNDGIWEGLNARERLDLLIVECAFPNSRADICRLAKHYCPEMLALDLQKLRHRPRVGITHLKPGGEDTTWAECREAIHGFDLFRVEQDQILEI